MPLPTCVYSTEIQFESKKLEKKAAYYGWNAVQIQIGQM